MTPHDLARLADQIGRAAQVLVAVDGERGDTYIVITSRNLSNGEVGSEQAMATNICEQDVPGILRHLASQMERGLNIEVTDEFYDEPS